MDLKRLSRADQIFGGAGLVLFILMFIKPWAKIEGAGVKFTANGWQSYSAFGKLAALLALAAVVLVALKLAEQKVVIPPVAYLAVGAATLLCLLLMLLSGPEGNSFGVERGFLLYLGVLLAAAVAYGGYLLYKGTSPAGAGTTTTTTTPPPAT